MLFRKFKLFKVKKEQQVTFDVDGNHEPIVLQNNVKILVVADGNHDNDQQYNIDGNFDS